ncbi:MAG: phosphotransferase family protein [Gammaproteobacteria bacterium]
MQLEELRPCLDRFVRLHHGERAEVRGLGGFSGSHGGLTYGFEIWDAAHETRLERLVIRLAPVGVKRSGNTDVLRQVPLLTTLAAHGFPVAPIRYHGADDDCFPTAYVMFERVPGRAFIVWEPDPAFARDNEHVAPLWRQAVAAMARVHAFDWRTHLANWQDESPIAEEVARWDPILAKTVDPEWLAAGEEVRALLNECGPPPSPVGLMHGDCQPGNLLFDDDGRLVAMLDWELSAIGAQLYDLGWLVMIGDRASWDPDYCPVNPMSPEALIAEYVRLTGRAVPGIAWYRALAGYRMAVVSGLFIRLHREGRRPDPAWERMARGVPAMYGRARELLLDYLRRG